jgi:hypothetical protein
MDGVFIDEALAEVQQLVGSPMAAAAAEAAEEAQRAASPSGSGLPVPPVSAGRSKSAGEAV